MLSKDPVGLDVDELASKIDGRLVVSVDKINWGEVGKDFIWAVVCKLVSGKTINKYRFEEVLGKIWKLDKEAEYLKVEKDLILVNFKTEKDQSKILDGGPWSIDNSDILMQKWENGMMGEDFNNTKINIWVQLHRLPFELRNPKAAKKLAEIAGKVKEGYGQKNESDNTYGGEFQKFRIELDTSNPITPGFFLERQGRKPVWVQFKYGKLPPYYYNCGRMSHDLKFCQFKQESDSSLFGKWLRAEDHSWNIPVWPIKSNNSSKLKTVAIESLENSSEIKTVMQPSIIDESVLQQIPRSKGVSIGKEIVVTEKKEDSINIDIADKSASEVYLQCDMEVTEENIPYTSVKNSNGSISIFDPGLKGDKVKRPREPNKEAVFIRKSRKVSSESRPLEAKGISQEEFTDVPRQVSEVLAEVATQPRRGQ